MTENLHDETSMKELAKQFVKLMVAVEKKFLGDVRSELQARGEKANNAREKCDTHGQRNCLLCHSMKEVFGDGPSAAAAAMAEDAGQDLRKPPPPIALPPTDKLLSPAQYQAILDKWDPAIQSKPVRQRRIPHPEWGSGIMGGPEVKAAQREANLELRDAVDAMTPTDLPLTMAELEELDRIRMFGGGSEQYKICDNHRWLIAQSKRAIELAESRDTIAACLHDEIHALQNRIAEKDAVLQFYAETENYDWIDGGYLEEPPVRKDRGHRAREALKS